MIIGPNEAVLNQWEANLIMSGIDEDHIKYYECNDKNLLHREETFILMTRYSLMTEVRHIIKGDISNLFPTLSIDIKLKLGEVLRNSEKGMGEAKKTEQITKILGSNLACKCFRTLIIDEAHMMKNLATYWGVGVGLLTSMSYRNIPLSGTPFIHGPQDMATLMVYIDPNIPASTKQWWKDATKIKPGEDIVKSAQQWRRSYLVRREKSVLAKELPTKTILMKSVGSFGSELAVYNEHEKAFFDALAAFRKMSTESEDKRELVNFLFAQLTCMVCSAVRIGIYHITLLSQQNFSPSSLAHEPYTSFADQRTGIYYQVFTITS